jgi:hypothetical protein
MSSDTSYRRLKPGEVLTTPKLLACLIALESADPNDDAEHVGWWRCWTEDCDVSTVSLPGITFKRKPNCPLCGRLLTLEAVLRPVRMVPVS